ncbi:hypothetical protein E2C01_062819 [Portunus trituberculatus]|uniref:Uncharacterized protein n=1 Tax=Portunus trituberculatus TaxID=210409 RepID=A0A5B7HH52_PORTR|nr:hypothetical protein [Portunus trituberculatus]
MGRQTRLEVRQTRFSAFPETVFEASHPRTVVTRLVNFADRQQVREVIQNKEYEHLSKRKAL